MEKIIRASIEVIRDFTYMTTYGIPLLWVADLVDTPLWAWFILSLVYSLTNSFIKVADD